MLATPMLSAPLLSSLVSSWLLGAVAAAPLPTYDVLFLHADAATTQSQAERERERERAEQERERIQQEQERARERAQQERERARERAQQERERAQHRAEQERERRQRQAEHARQQRQRSSDYHEVEGEKIVKSFSVGREGNLLLHNVSGDIVVTAGGSNDIRVEAVKRAKGRTPSEAKQQLDNVQVSIQNAGGRVEVLTAHSGRESRAWVSFTVNVPYDARVELHSVSGDISVTGVKGELRAETVSGDVTATTVSRLVLLKSLSGDVEINGAESDGVMTFGSVSGGVTGNNLKARGVDVSSVSGDTVLSNCACDRAQVSSISGDVTYGGRLAKAGRYELKTHSGSITLQYMGSGFDLAASTFSGDVRFEPALPSTLKNTSSRYGPGRSIRGSVSGGGASVELTTFSGDILVTKGGQ